MSEITVIGNVGEPTLKFTNSGKAVLEFSLAQNHSKKNAQGGWDDDGTTWRRVTIWERKAEALGEILKKGDRVIVQGTERLREWEGKDGSTGKTLELSARDVGIIPRVQTNQPSQGGQQDDPWAAPANAGASSGGGWGNGLDSEPPF